METQRKTILFTVGLLAAVALFGAACDNEADSTPTTHAERPPITEPAESAEPTDGVVTADNPIGTDETAYSAALAGFNVETGTDELGVNLGYATCEAWDLGESFTATMLAISPLDGSGFTATESGYIMAAAAMYLCPNT